MPNEQRTSDIVTVDLRPYIGPAANLLGAIIIAASIMLSGGVAVGGAKGATTTTPPSAVDAGDDLVVTAGVASIDDDAIKGDISSATVAIVEFSDYECPFCQSFWQTTLPQLEETYIDTGDVVLVYRDLPLSFHEPGASREANATECVRDQQGDDAYFAMHDYIFTNSPGNGPGVSVDDLVSFGESIGANGSQLRSCIENQDFADEIAADSLAASAAGVNGTPGFIVGTLDADGNVNGEIVSGAQPFSTFQAIIDSYL